jgi:hypothetical protein
VKAGVTIQELAAKLETAKAEKADYIAPSQHLQLLGSVNKLEISGIEANSSLFEVTDHTHSQIAAKLDIPAKYYNRMKTESPELLARNVNHWFQDNPQRRNMVRTRAGRARAFLSDRYQRIDNEEVAEMVLPILGSEPDLRIESCEVTESRMYIKAVTPRLEGEVRKGDVIQGGITVANSEIGLGTLTAIPLTLRLVCLNGATVNDSAFRAVHLGARADKSDSTYQILSDETIRADDKAILLRLRDVVKHMMSEEVFNRALDKMRGATEDRITTKLPEKTVEALAKKTGLFEEERSSVLQHLLTGGDLTRFGLMQAVTRTAQDVKSYDRATELEAIGGRMLDLPRSDWRELAEAA